MIIKRGKKRYVFFLMVLASETGRGHEAGNAAEQKCL